MPDEDFVSRSSGPASDEDFESPNTGSASGGDASGRRAAPAGAHQEEPAPGQEPAVGAAGTPGEDGTGEPAVSPDGDEAGDRADERPEEWHPEEDDRTAETLRWLVRKRRAERRRRSRDLVVLAYTVVLAAIGYGGGYTALLLRKLSLGADHGDLGEDIRQALPPAFTLLAAVLALIAARDALWRGPVVVPGPAVGWLLTQPVRREAVLRPRLRRSAALAVFGGLLTAAAGAVVLHVTDLAPFGRGLLALLPAAVCLPLLATFLAVAVERRPGLADRVRRLTPGAVAVILLLALRTGLAATGRPTGVPTGADLWSGPWGWAAQPVLRAAGGHAPGWPVAVAALLLLTLAAWVPARRDADRIGNAQLRRRAATVSAVHNGVATMELRAARLAMAAASAGPGRHRWRPRPPRDRRLAVVWRDAVALLRSPGRLGTALTGTMCAAAVAGVAVRTDGELRAPLLVAALFSGYAAVAALAEPARLETDDVRRSAWSPLRLRALMLRHTVLPAASGTLLAALAAVPYALAGAPWTLLVMPLCAPPLAAAAVVAACRGPVRTDLLMLGVVTPAGSPGPFLVAFWYAAGPLVAVGGLALTLHGVPAAGPGAPSVVPVALASVVLTVALLAYAARSADRLVRRG
ncbi:hypothetical protein IHE55_26575 [Streptomyces pactum]|uniref:ABC transporter permease n=1 Tax=Streptomyces pactum TaxID=68249 RepID=A0ABS0NSG3_9ACTN|nr:DUF6297 family protein [Streptomyces pactum]MBH5338154.1 hypothetical protein [Streptomyces pactum]